MGIDLLVKFPEGVFPFKDNCMEFMKYALMDTECDFIQLFLDYNYNLYLLFDNGIRYWSTDHVVDMYKFLERLYLKKLQSEDTETDYEFKNDLHDNDSFGGYYYEKYEHKLHLHKYKLEDIKIILDYFRIIVDNKGCIVVS